MAAPIFDKTGVPAVTFTRARTYPVGDTWVPNQFVGVSDANTIRVASLGSPRQLIGMTFDQLDRSDRTALLAFFQNPKVNWGLYSFTLTDEDSNSYTVKFLEPEFRMPEETDDNVSLTITLTVL